MRDVGLSSHLGFGGLWVSVHIFFEEVVGLSPHLCFRGWGEFFLKFVLLGGGGGFTLIS